MTIYFITILILFLFCISEVTKKGLRNKNFMLASSYLILVFVIGLRWETGTDWDPYLETFNYSVDLIALRSVSSSMELGYLFLNFLVRQLTDNYSLFLLLHASIFYALIIKSFEKLVPNPQVAILLFFCINIGITGSNRQLLAVGICMLGLTFLVANNYKKFLIYVVGAFFFHSSAVLFSIYYFFNRRIKDIYLYGVIILSIGIGKTSIPNFIFSLFGIFGGIAEDKTKVYMEVGDAINDPGLSMLGLLKRIIFVFMFIYLRKKMERKAGQYNLFLNGYVFGVAFYFIFSSTFLIMVNRGSIYFNMMESLILSLILLLFNRSIDKIVYLFFLLILGISLFFQSISAYPDLFDPYKGVFINSEYYRPMY